MACENKTTIEGLWIVKSVRVGEQEMTPNAKWARFNSDLAQESGNGWFQHSYGIWNLDPKTNELSFINFLIHKNDLYKSGKVNSSDSYTIAYCLI